ncbi:putative toxin-antitoxin system toxin component, PIN family [Dolichospermum circinale]|uniref:putative toxin-antitoxin system toxin component, PIN family n=1 Tax=Dolichospermum circinale TaxID=109265 RepID=UPI000420D65D|nr:putative toxin-antitoxin system toxin component, PIN family [Dolichospermum circinale]MDB9476985.1 putative toxin-antitoxin system toxin component, PIN family [Dolichospermum circinale CS-537/11]MDB9477227.1 putative toxin-antitoxin system toxin component, PIN family [Dolichospermum circinale CS-537/03]MDB9490566.1 putative toxin-antitoxin system toxin component, PIN family [Dolichospermum circinale CS-534/05]
MDELRFVVDTNILVSAVLIKSSIPDVVFKKARSLGIILFSDATFQELQEILNRSKFDKYISVSVRTQFLAKFKLESEETEIVQMIKECRDPKDDKFLEVAINGNVTHIITGDKDLLELHSFQGVDIITATQFLEIFSV